MDEKQRTRLEIIEILGQMLGGEMSYIEGSRVLVSLLSLVDLGEMDPFVTFEAIESETDDIPLGDTRANWSSDALENHAAKRRQAEVWAQRIGEPATRKALAILR